MTLQYLLFWGMESGLLFLRERRRGVWCRMRAAPVSLGCVLTAKALSTAAIALLQVLVTFAFGYLAFGVAVTGSFVGFVLLALTACGLAAATGLARRRDWWNRSASAKREHPGHPRNLDGRRVVGAVVPVARLGARHRVVAADFVGDVWIGRRDVAGIGTSRRATERIRGGRVHGRIPDASRVAIARRGGPATTRKCVIECLQPEGLGQHSPGQRPG